MVINGLCQSVEDDDIVVKKMTLDFMIKHIKIENQETFNENQVTQLIFSLFKIITCNDLSLIKRLAKFMFNENDFAEVSLDDVSDQLKEICCKVYKMYLSKETKMINSLRPFVMIQDLQRMNP